LKANGHVVGFVGDGINDVPALHEADVGISVNSAVDVAKDSSDIILLKKNLDILAEGVEEGRKIFGNTMKYILMGTSSDFGNMISMTAASLFLPFIPMLPTQILLNDLLYDVSQTTISTDNVDKEYIKKPKKFKIDLIKKYMLFFGPISSIYDFIIFAIMILLFHASAILFRTGWFVESAATQILVVFAIRTRRIPFYKSKPGKWIIFSCLATVGIAAIIPFTPLGEVFSFTPIPALFFLVIVAIVVTYLILIEIGKKLFFDRYEI